ncbi:MAG: S41 family peptidase [Patescibacteria group bacterium]
MKIRSVPLGLFLAVSLLLARPAPAQVAAVETLSPRILALAEIIRTIEENSFYELSEKELNAVQECMAGRAFRSFEMKKGEMLKEDLKITSCFPQDKRAMYFPPAVAKNLNEAREGHFSGIGISVAPDEEIGGIAVKEILPAGPVEKDGRLKVGDVITAVGEFVEGQEIKTAPLKGLDFGKMIEMVRGAPGTKIALEVRRGGQKLPLIIIAREDVKIQSVKAYEIEPGVGYLKIHSFLSLNVAADVWLVLAGFKDKNINKLIVDLRRNSGGLMNETMMIASFFTPRIGDLILEARWRGQKTGQGQRFTSPLTGPFSEIKTVVLIDGSSASASEILAGSLKIWGAKVVGVKSYGKGSIQTVIPLSDGGEFSLTTGLYYLADGKTPEDGGIEPHFVIEDDPRTPDVDEALAVATGILMDP